MNAFGVGTMRQALADLPAETSYGNPPPLREVYLPPSHLKALHPDTQLVTGMRGAGKTFWWSALQDPRVRGLIGEQAGGVRSQRTAMLTRNTMVHTGFGERTAPDEYPNREVMLRLVESGIDSRTIWRTVQAWHLLPYGEDDHPLLRQRSWETRAKYVERHPEAIDRLFQERDDELEWKRAYFLILFDALDRCADDWRDMSRAIRGLLQTTLELRSYRWLRAKVFLRSDQVDESEVADFPDASKVLSASVELNWPRPELYGLLWHCLCNRENGEVFRRLFGGEEWTSTIVDGHELYAVPRRLVADEVHQREKFEAIASPSMGRDRRRGIPYSWIPGHLADTRGRVSPRSFLAALRTAALDTADRYPEYGCALHFESIKRGVWEASKIRIRELQEDYPWVHGFVGSLKGMVVPCTFEEIAERWRCKHVLERLVDDVTGDDMKLPPRHANRGSEGIREDLESLGIFLRMRDGRVNVPDVFRVGFGLGRRGGVKPVR